MKKKKKVGKDLEKSIPTRRERNREGRESC